jgi:selenide,water dikinase
LPPQGIAQVLRGLPKIHDPNLLVGTETADDAGVYRLTDDLAIVQTIDFFPPVVDDPFIYGQIAAANAISDIYAMGGTPKTALNLVGFPDDKLPLSLLGEILRGGAERAKEAACVILGGHTVRDAEIKYGMAVTGVVHPKRILTNASAKPGDKLILTKPLGTGFVTTAHKANDCPAEAFDSAVRSMIQLNQAGRDAMLEVGVHSATDITGFGLAGHAYEMAQGSGVTFIIDLERLPLLPRVGELVRKGYFTRASKTNATFVASGLRVEGNPDPIRREVFYDAQTSGGLLISVPGEKAEQLAKTCIAKGTLTATIIGEVTPKQDVWLVARG